MTDKQLQAYRIYQRFLRTLLTISGCWYMPTKFGKTTYFLPVFTFLMMVCYASIFVHMSYILRHNLENMVKCIAGALGGASAVLKVTIFVINRDSLKNYHQTLNDLFEEELKQNEKIRTIIFSPLRRIYTLTYTYFIVLETVVLAYVAPPYIFVIRGLCQRHLTTNYTLPVSRGFGHFWTVPDNFLYHFHFFFEIMLALICSIITCSVDSIFGFYVCQFTSTLRAMIFRLTNPLPAEKFSDLLRNCVAKHQRLLRCRDILEHVYGPIVFWHIVTNALFLCALIYNATRLSLMTLDDRASTIAFVTQSLVKLLQTFTYAFYGTVLANAGEDFRNGIYFSKWINSRLDRHVRTNIILLLMQKPMFVNAFFTPVNMIMFTNFVNTTMSYFFLLQSVGDKGG
ncbi:PREDICTED: uncharacterized protein LOC105456034 [Wasmannia auropunctata]|uniref:uncharacterized protein LOC105456034 n=1 Tax=Wasmannia auropunctata TaxID=64793 RepID=UPI0005F07807|nr:PREDICTED: uncharacterized protein LOC105456034 [Wasmannia auropunctata]